MDLWIVRGRNCIVEEGSYISSYRSKQLTEFFGEEMELVMTVCDRAKAICPVFPLAKETLYAAFPDPSAGRGSERDPGAISIHPGRTPSMDPGAVPGVPGGSAVNDRCFTLLTCSGVPNTGRLTTQAASVLVRRDPERFECHLTAKQATRDLLKELEHSDCLVIIDGCADRCATKKLRESGIEPEIHIIATDHGISKNGMAEVQFWEIEQLIQGILQEVER